MFSISVIFFIQGVNLILTMFTIPFQNCQSFIFRGTCFLYFFSFSSNHFILYSLLILRPHALYEFTSSVGLVIRVQKPTSDRSVNYCVLHY
jgi:hypothetical protein